MILSDALVSAAVTRMAAVMISACLQVQGNMYRISGRVLQEIEETAAQSLRETEICEGVCTMDEEDMQP